MKEISGDTFALSVGKILETETDKEWKHYLIKKNVAESEVKS